MAADSLFAQQWHLVRIQLVNWGTFNGYHDFPIVAHSADGQSAVVMITGESGTGKSTLFDAKTAVMMKSNVRFNSASNRAISGHARGKRERNVYAYLMGKRDDEYDAQTGEERESFLRTSATAQWSAVVLTYSAAQGEVFSAARFYYVAAHAPSGEFDTKFLTAHASIDPRALEPFASERFTRGLLEQVFPGSVTYDGPTKFLRAIYEQLGIGRDGEGDNAMSLHERIQSGYPLTDVDALFKDLVIDEPSTYSLATSAVASFDEHESIWDQMDIVRQKLADLAGIRENYAGYTSHLERLNLLKSLDADNPTGPFALWCARRRHEVLNHALTEKRDAVGRLEAELSARDVELEKEKARYAELMHSVSESGGAMIDRLRDEVADAQALLRVKKAALSELKGASSAVGSPLPADAQAYDALVTQANALMEGFESISDDLAQQAAELAMRKRELDQETEDAQEQLDYYLEHPVRITPRMAQARDQMARAAGMSPADLPYAAELMDMAQGQEHWRLAANIGYHGLATTVLVSRDQLDDLSVAINGLKLGYRVSFRGVRVSDGSTAAETQAKHSVAAPGECRPSSEGMLADKIIVKPGSPFSAWIQEQIADPERAFECVEDPADLPGKLPAITREGQTRAGSRGAHGYNQRDTLVIGFTNEGLVAELRQRLASLSDELRDVARSTREVSEQRRLLTRRRDLALWVRQHTWGDIDVETAQRQAERLSKQLEELLHNEDLERLIHARDVQADLVEKLQRAYGAALGALEAERTVTGALDGAVEETRNQVGRIEGAGSVLTVAQTVEIESFMRPNEEVWRAVPGSPYYPLAQNFDAVADRTLKDIGRAASAEQGWKTRDEGALVKTFEDYKRHWLGADDPTGTTPESYPDYERMLTDLENSGLAEPAEQWLANMFQLVGRDLVPLANAYTADLREIRRRMDPINQIMGRFAFGPEGGHLSIAMSERTPADISRFRARMVRWAAYATQDLAVNERLHAELKTFMEELRADIERSEPRLLNTKRMVRITVLAQYPAETGRADNVYSSLDAKSGGETQELIAFILGAALLFCLGDNGESLPAFAPVFLDEAFIKADEHFTQRAIRALAGLGFQVIIAVPTSKVQAVEPIADQYVCISKNAQTGCSYITPMELEGRRA